MTSCALLALAPYAPDQRTSPGPLDQIAAAFPELLGIPVLFLFSFPLGCGILYLAVLEARNKNEWLLPIAYGRGGPHSLDRCSSQLRWNPGS